ncbi:MAG: malate synthase A, partial [Alphaproteobacteria bacterium]
MELTAGIEIKGARAPGFEKILEPAALHFIAGLERRFGAERKRLIVARAEFQQRLDGGENPRFLPETADVRAGDWKVAGVPEDLQDRRVEITGPVERKMVINALNSGARMFMADFEDSAAPTWELMINGQINLRDAVRREITFSDPKSGRNYALGETIATLIVRPRGWHLEEAHITVDGAPASAALVDFGLYFFHNAEELLARGTGPYFYLPKIESHL